MRKSNKNNGFKTPEGYFEGLTDRLLNKLSDPDSNARDAVVPKEEGFVVPEGYFDSLNKNISDKLNSEDVKVVQLNPYRKYYFAAASIAAVVLAIFGLNLNTSAAPTFESLAESDIESYFENNDYDLSAFEIAEVIPIDELEINDILTSSFEEENLINYLDENLDDFEELNLEDYE